MRKAFYKDYKNVDHPVMFHKFTMLPIQENAFAGGWTWVNYPMAIVEFGDGHVETVNVDRITFAEPAIEKPPSMDELKTLLKKADAEYHLRERFDNGYLEMKGQDFYRMLELMKEPL